jgi:hypothetical protein
MMVMTAKVDMKKILLILAAVAALILSVILLTGDAETTTQTAAPSVSSNDGRVQFLKGFGWDVVSSPAQTSQVRIPEETTEVFDRYNALQKSQGYDLSTYAGKQVMRYVYTLNNYPNATEPVYATLLVYKGKIIGGDVTDTAAKGQVRGFKMPEAGSTVPSQPEATSPVPESTS